MRLALNASGPPSNLHRLLAELEKMDRAFFVESATIGGDATSSTMSLTGRLFVLNAAVAPEIVAGKVVAPPPAAPAPGTPVPGGAPAPAPATESAPSGDPAVDGGEESRQREPRPLPARSERRRLRKALPRLS